jgi:hypothetical protein
MGNRKHKRATKTLQDPTQADLALLCKPLLSTILLVH